MSDQYAQMLINELRNIVKALKNLSHDVSEVGDQIRRK